VSPDRRPASRIRNCDAERKERYCRAPQSGKDRDLWGALRDPRVVVLGAVNFGILFSGYGIQLWLPQIVQAMGFSNTATGLIVALPFAACVPVMILWGRSSDAKDERIWHVALPALFAAACLAALPPLALSSACRRRSCAAVRQRVASRCVTLSGP
jgi:MFS family permease